MQKIKEIMQQYFTEEEYRGYLKGRALESLLQSSNEKQLEEIKTTVDNLKIGTVENPKKINIGDYIFWEDFYADWYYYGIVVKYNEQNGDFYTKDIINNKEYTYSPKYDTLEKHIPKLEEGKWYNSSDFYVNELQLLLPVGTKVLTGMHRSNFSIKPDCVKEVTKHPAQASWKAYVKIDSSDLLFEQFMIPIGESQ